MNLLVRGDASRAREDLLDIAMALPFQNETNTGFGILAKVYLDALHALYDDKIVSRDDDGVFEAKEAAMECVDETFDGVRNPRQEVERGFRFWDAVSFPMHFLFELTDISRPCVLLGNYMLMGRYNPTWLTHSNLLNRGLNLDVLNRLNV